MVQRQHVDARAEPHARGGLRDGGEEHVLRRCQTVDRGRVVLGEVIGVDAGRLEALDLDQALAIDLIEAQPGHRLDVVEDPESKTHPPSRFTTGTWYTGLVTPRWRGAIVETPHDRRRRRPSREFARSIPRPESARGGLRRSRAATRDPPSGASPPGRRLRSRPSPGGLADEPEPADIR